MELDQDLSIPRVEWSFKSNGDSFVMLNDSEFWEREYNKYYCDKTATPFSPDLRDYSGPSHFDCIGSKLESNFTSSSYDCSLRLEHLCFLDRKSVV